MTTSNHPPLPQSTASVSLQILEGGSFSANLEVVHADSASKPFKCQSWVIYIYHKASGRHILWDVGLSAVSKAERSSDKPAGPVVLIV